MKIQKGIQSGTLGTTVSVNSKDGQVGRTRPRHNRQETEARLRSRNNCATYSRLWGRLTDQQREGWMALALHTSCRSAGGTGAPLHGCQLLVKINCTLAAAGLPPVKNPPRPAKFGPNPVQRLRITSRQGKVKLELALDHPPAAHIVVLGSRPCSAGISVRSSYSIIGLLPAPKRGLSDITALYVARFGEPPPGRRVFIRTRQIINGWVDAFKDTHARVPEAGDATVSP